MTVHPGRTDRAGRHQPRPRATRPKPRAVRSSDANDTIRPFRTPLPRPRMNLSLLQGRAGTCAGRRSNRQRSPHRTRGPPSRQRHDRVGPCPDDGRAAQAAVTARAQSDMSSLPTMVDSAGGDNNGSTKNITSEGSGLYSFNGRNRLATVPDNANPDPGLATIKLTARVRFSALPPGQGHLRRRPQGGDHDLRRQRQDGDLPSQDRCPGACLQLQGRERCVRPELRHGEPGRNRLPDDHVRQDGRHHPGDRRGPDPRLGQGGGLDQQRRTGVRRGARATGQTSSTVSWTT